MERALCVAALLTALGAIVCVLGTRSRCALLTLRLRLVEQRERDSIAAMRTFSMASRGSSQEVLRALDRALRKLDPGIDAMLAFVPQADELCCAFASGDRTDHHRQLRVRRDGATLIARAAAARHRLVLRESVDALLPTDRAAIAIPMLEGDRVHAVIYVSTARVSGFASTDAIVQAVDHASMPHAIALERERDRQEATYDALTGLLTAVAFRRRLSEAVARAKLQPIARLAVWFIDTDGFKAVNDTCGHAAGDDVLRAMAALLRAHAIAEVDLVGRNGGDEFCALLVGSAKTVAIQRAQAFCEAVRRHPFDLPLRITTSIGVAAYPLDAREVSELLEIADAAMYHSKRSGRDRVAFSVDGTAFRVFD